LDFYDDGIVPSWADYGYLALFVNFQGPPPNPLHGGDINVDGYIDVGDLVLFDSLLTEFSWFPCFGSIYHPWPTSCHPDTIRGGCWAGDSCVVRSPANCANCGGMYLGDGVSCACDCAGLGDLNLDGTIDPLDAAILANFIYKSQDAREPILLCSVENGDWDCSGTVDPVDMAYCVLYVYLSWGDPPCDPCIE